MGFRLCNHTGFSDRRSALRTTAGLGPPWELHPQVKHLPSGDFQEVLGTLWVGLCAGPWKIQDESDVDSGLRQLAIECKVRYYAHSDKPMCNY